MREIWNKGWGTALWLLAAVASLIFGMDFGVTLAFIILSEIEFLRLEIRRRLGGE